jgi:hypothetical protein
MVANFVYYMVKYKCILAVSEGPKVARVGDADVKFALIANPRTLLTSDYLTIKSAGLSSKAMELYNMIFSADLTKIYRDDYKDDYTRIWDGNIFSPYLMSKSEKLRDMFNSMFGEHNPEFIQDLE